MKVRRLKADDLEALAGLYKHFWQEESSLEKMQETFKKLEGNPNYILLCAEQQGNLAGSAMGIICDELYGECKPFMVVEDVVVDKDHRRCGIGTSLMRELEKYAAECKCSYIIFVTESERKEAHLFYESLGYKTDAYKGFKKKLSDNKQDKV